MVEVRVSKHKQNWLDMEHKIAPTQYAYNVYA
jgi:hypothetical protein